MIHTTVGVYNNDSHKINGVLGLNLKSHIRYNIEMRPGRALFVDGKCLNKGYLSKERCDAWEKTIKDNPDQFTKTVDTQPYV